MQKAECRKALVLHASLCLLPFRRNSSLFAPRRVMLPFWGSIQLRDDEIIL
jgi:hypothetical protein